MYSEHTSKVDGPGLSFGNGGRGKNPLAWRNDNQRPGPYAPRLKYTPADAEAPGKWGHDLFGQQVKGGNLAFRLNAESAAEAKIAARNGGGQKAGGDLMDPSFDLLGRVQVEPSRVKQPRRAAPPTEPRRGGKPINILGKSGGSGKTWVLVANLVAGTTAEDVKTTFDQFGEIAEAKVAPSPKGTVSVLLQFDHKPSAQEAISTFHAQIADGRPISVTLHQPAVPAPAPARQSEAAPAPTWNTSLGSRISGGTTSSPGPKTGEGLFKRLGLAAIAAPAGRGAPPPPRRPRGRAAAGQSEGDLMDLFSDSKMRSDGIDDSRASSQVIPGANSRRGGRGGRRGGGHRGGRPMTRGVGGMDVD